MTRSRSSSSKRERRSFTAEFKQEALRLLEERRAVGVSLAQVGRELGVRPDLLRRWARAMAAQADGKVLGQRAPASESEASELRRLRRENEVLRQERDFLKKASVYFAKESR